MQRRGVVNLCCCFFFLPFPSLPVPLLLPSVRFSVFPSLCLPLLFLSLLLSSLPFLPFASLCRTPGFPSVLSLFPSAPFPFVPFAAKLLHSLLFPFTVFRLPPSLASLSLPRLFLTCSIRHLSMSPAATCSRDCLQWRQRRIRQHVSLEKLRRRMLWRSSLCWRLARWRLSSGRRMLRRLLWRKIGRERNSNSGESKRRNLWWR